MSNLLCAASKHANSLQPNFNSWDLKTSWPALITQSYKHLSPILSTAMVASTQNSIEPSTASGGVHLRPGLGGREPPPRRQRQRARRDRHRPPHPHPPAAVRSEAAPGRTRPGSGRSRAARPKSAFLAPLPPQHRDQREAPERRRRRLTLRHRGRRPGRGVEEGIIRGEEAEEWRWWRWWW